jgi:hypothetical protein
MKWFRLYNDILYDYKMRELGASKAFRFFQLMAYINANYRRVGSIPAAELQHFCNISGARLQQIQRMITQCIELEIISSDGQFYTLTNWNKRQYKTDDVNSRVQEHREKQPEKSKSVTLHVTPPDTDTDTEQKLVPKGTCQKQAFNPSPVLELFSDILPGLAQPKQVGGSRRTALKARMREQPKLDWWYDYFRAVEKQPFLTGENDKGWRADFDWLLKPANVSKVLELKYLTATVDPAEKTRQVLAKMKAEGKL